MSLHCIYRKVVLFMSVIFNFLPIICPPCCMCRPVWGMICHISEKLMNQYVNNKEPKFIVWASFHSILSFLNYCSLQRRGSDSPSPGEYHFEYLHLFSIDEQQETSSFMNWILVQSAQYLVAMHRTYTVNRINLAIKCMHNVMAAILMFQNNETAAMLVNQSNPVGVQLFSYVNTFFCSKKFAWLLDICECMCSITPLLLTSYFDWLFFF